MNDSKGIPIPPNADGESGEDSRRIHTAIDGMRAVTIEVLKPILRGQADVDMRRLGAKGAKAAIENALADIDARRRSDIAFHLTDWFTDGAFLVALAVAPDRFTPEQVRAGVVQFLIHAPNHIAAAAKLGGAPVKDVFKVDALEADDEVDDGNWIPVPPAT